MNYAVNTSLNCQQIQFLCNTEKLYNHHIFNLLYLGVNTILLERTLTNNRYYRLSEKAGNIIKKLETKSCIPYKWYTGFCFLLLIWITLIISNLII
jgi:hypothetical protein